MEVHYFQRYTQKENVATANTMLLLSRLYMDSTSKFYKFLQNNIFNDKANLEIEFTLQEKHKNSVPDATIFQPSFKVVVETKMKDDFDCKQLRDHLEAFDDVQYKVLLTLASKKMKDRTRLEFEKRLKEYNEEHSEMIYHVNLTFEDLITSIDSILDDKDYDMSNILNDYIDYCIESDLLPNTNSWKTLRMQLSRTTFDFNMNNNVYYDKASRNFRPHDYIGLYRDKKINAVGKIETQVVTEYVDGILEYKVEKGHLTEQHKQVIQDAIKDSKQYGYDLTTIPHRYFFVEEFYESNYKKDSKGGAMGTRYFDLEDILGITKETSTEEIVNKLNQQTWS